MKKTFLILTVVLISGVSVTAQDTLYSNDMRLIPNYYVPVWFDSFDYDDYYKVYHAYILKLGENNNTGITQRAWKMYTDDTLTVYGLAGGFSTTYRLNPDYWARYPYGMGDTSCTHSRIYMRLYEADTNSLRLIADEQMVHLNQTPISYYIDLELAKRPEPWNKLPLIPMYDRYFSSPVTVADSFYVGVRFRDSDLSGAITNTLLLQTINNPNIDCAYYSRIYDYTISDTIERWIYSKFPTGDGVPFLFPIIAPPDTTSIPDSTFTSDTTSVPDSTFTSDTTFVPDTTQVVDSTARIIAPDLVYRYTAVQPNPATEKVRVTSSFGLGRIEAYDESGRRVFGTTASGMVATIDVASWKKGVYLLRIATGAGPTTKRLIVK